MASRHCIDNCLCVLIISTGLTFFRIRPIMDKRSTSGALLHRLVCCVWLLSAVSLKAGANCPDKQDMPHNCTCSKEPFAVNCTNSGLKTIPNNLPHAPSMTIANNKITSLTTIPYDNLVKLILTNNEIELVQDKVFQHLNSLTKLILSGNSIVLLRPDVFAGLSSLMTLVLHGNPLYHLQSGLFNGSYMPMLSTLKLSQCSIYEISENAFDGLTKLQDLDLSHNHITSLTSATGGKGLLSELISLDVSHNWIVDIGKDDFGGLSKLNTLVLSHNKLTTISSTVFKGLHNNLTTLDLSYNRLTDISPAAFKYMPVLSALSLQFNFLTTLDVNAIPWHGDEPVVLVHDNPWRCDCDLKWMFEKKSISAWNTNGTTK